MRINEKIKITEIHAGLKKIDVNTNAISCTKFSSRNAEVPYRVKGEPAGER